MKFTPIIGLEVHVQLLTRTKIFCGCANRFNPEHPNVQTCPVCLGLPGALPVLNRHALELSIRAGLALHGDIARSTKWDRKQYYYPDLPKGYQISQYDLPFCAGGWLDLELDPADGSATSRVRLIRVHLEEDAGKNVHDETGDRRDSLVDLNRAGTPLLEIVSEPDIRSPEEARRFLEELRLLLIYQDISDCNMQEGSLRCDANVNLHAEPGDGPTQATPIVEIKNLNSFRGVEAAVAYEIERQQQQVEQSGFEDLGSAKETRGWDADRGVTVPQRGKEEASDYRYFPDPDLVPIRVSDEWRETIRETLHESPADRRRRFRGTLGLSDYDAGVLIDRGRPFADYFESVADACGDAKLAANWVTQDVQRELNQRGVGIEEFPLAADVLAALLARVQSQDLTKRSAREVFEELLEAGKTPRVSMIKAIIKKRGLAATDDIGQLDSLLDDVIEQNQQAADDFRNGKDAAIGRLIGEVMRQAKGADPAKVREALIVRLRGSEA